MTANKSNNISFAIINFKQKVYDMKIFIMLLVLNIMGFPYLFINAIYNDDYNSYMISFFAFALLIGAGVLIPLLKFSYLNQRSKVDLVYALPLTRKQLFFSDYFAGLTLYLVPYVLQMILMQILILFIPNTGGVKSYYFGRLDPIFSHAYMLKFSITVLFIMLFLYTLTVFIISCTGNLFEAITASLYCNILIPVFFLVFNVYIVGSLYSLRQIELIKEIIMHTSPIGGIVYLAKNNSFAELFQWLFFYTIFIAILFVLSLKIQTKRHAEDISKPFVIRTLYYTIIGTVIFIIGTFLYHTSIGYINIVIILTVVYFLIELVSNRGLSKLYRSLIRYIVVLSSLILFLFIYTKTEGFGVVYRTSKASNLNSITITFDGILANDFNQYQEYIVTEPEFIELLLELHQKQLKLHKVNPVISDDSVIHTTKLQEIQSRIHAYTTEETELVTTPIEDLVYDQSTNFTMKFDVKTGLDYVRYYQISFDDLLLLAPIELSDRYIDFSIDNSIQRNYASISDIYMKSVNTLDIGRKTSIIRLLEALRLDLKDISLEEYLLPESSTQMFLEFSYYNRYAINPNYTHVIEFLKSNGLWINTSDDTYRSILATSNVYLVAPEASKAKDSKYYSSGYDYKSTISNNKITEFTDDVRTLFDNAAYQYVTDESCYYIFINQYRYVIPAAYSDVAERVYDYFISKQ